MSDTVSYPNAWYALVDYLRAIGVDTVFGLPADDLVVLRAIEATPIRMVLCRDQRNAAFMATGHALRSGGPAVCVIGKGPATTNVATGLLEANRSGAPLVVLAAGTASQVRGSGAFQELDQIAVLSPLVKWAHRVDHPSRVIPALERAFFLSTNGAPGPVYVELPDHLLTEEVVRTRDWRLPHPVRSGPDPAVLAESLLALRGASRRVLLVGGGMRRRNGDHAIERLAELLGAAVFATASGRGVVDETNEMFCGLAGLYSPQEAEPLWEQADLVVSLGSRLEETATFGKGFANPATPVLQVNVEPGDVSTDWGGPVVLADGAAVVQSWVSALAGEPDQPNREWVERVHACHTDSARRIEHEREQMAAKPEIHIAELLAALDTVLPERRILVQENGLQDMWSYFYPFWRCGSEADSIVPSEQTSLGFGASAAAGVRLAAPDTPVVAFIGDGAFGMLGNDLGVLVEEGIGVLYVVLRNGGYGWLQAQLNKAGGSGSRFSFVSADGTADTCHATQPGVHHVVLMDKDRLHQDLELALEATVKGQVAVVEVPVRLSDIPAALAELDGDFPVRPDENSKEVVTP
ncbi:thiamine pyrophosphate-binding protein [Micromonospora sp. RTGN7]|uniref:thiamine pyrophosphate-binding protein n=1 Tax=Micromonospora sp. RTGN7 TaxID=3016526 RepID=UPI0029FF2E8E|nr:thiamine pyrophosphate-binding protein [Micromonospora sp. RTGN7]